jgi:hypothetical protein
MLNEDQSLMESARFPSEDAEEKALFQEMKEVMEEEVAEMSFTATRRGFLQKIATVAAPATVVLLATGEEASACWLCDENYGCQAGCLLCNTNCDIINLCGVGETPCGMYHNQCGPCLTDI